MRLSEDQVKQGILHADKRVRNAALLYFTRSFSTDPAVMPLVIEAVKKYGWRDAVSLHAMDEGLVQTDETVVWLIAELKRVGRPDDQEWMDYEREIQSLLAAADPRLLEKHLAKLPTVADPAFQRTVNDRILLMSIDSDRCWQELEAFCQRARTAEFVSDIDLAPAYQLVEAIARDGRKHEERVLNLLHEDLDRFEGTTMAWLQPLAVRLAGEMRLEAAIGPILGLLHGDYEWRNEECEYALRRIGTQRVVEAIPAEYLDAPWFTRLYVMGPLEAIHTDGAAATCLDLLSKEPDVDLHFRLGHAALSHFTDAAVEPVRQLILQRRNEPEALSVEELLVAVSMLLGVDFPEMQEWEEETGDTLRWRRRVLMERLSDPDEVQVSLEDESREDD